MAITEKLYGFQKGILINGTIAMVTTSGVPSGAEYNAMAKGSLAFDSTAGLTYQKKTSTNSSADWVVIPTTADIAAAVADLGIPWLPDVKVYNNSALTLPTGTVGQPVTLDSGEIMGDGSRVIFAALTVGRGVYAYSESTGTFTAVTVGGTSDGFRISKPHVWTADEYAVGDSKTYIDIGNSLWVEDNDVSRTALGVDGSYVSTLDTTAEAVNKLDSALFGLSYSLTAITYANVTTATTIATFSTRSVKRASFIVSAKKSSNHAVSDSFYVDVEHDGTATIDAVNINSSGRYNDNLGFGVIAGFTYALTLTGTGATQAVNLTITSTDAVDVSALVVNKLAQ